MKKIIYQSALFIFFSGFVQLTNGQGFSQAVQKRLQAVIDSFQNNPANPFIGGMSAAIKIDGLAQWEGATGYAARNVDENNNVVPGGTSFKINPNFQARNFISIWKAYPMNRTLSSSMVSRTRRRRSTRPAATPASR